MIMDMINRWMFDKFDRLIMYLHNHGIERIWIARAICVGVVVAFLFTPRDDMMARYINLMNIMLLLYTQVSATEKEELNKELANSKKMYMRNLTFFAILNCFAASFLIGTSLRMDNEYSYKFLYFFIIAHYWVIQTMSPTEPPVRKKKIGKLVTNES